MTKSARNILLASLSIVALAACSTTSPTANRTDQSGAERVGAIMERAAREAQAAGNDAEALIILENLYEKNPDDPGIATAFAQSLREDEQLNRARQVLTPFTSGQEPYPDAVIELAMVKLALGQYKDAEYTARKAVEADPKSGRAYLALGTALDAQNAHEEAEEAFRRGIDNWKGDPAPILNNLALNLASQNKLDQALDLLYRAKEESPGRLEIERNIRIISTLKEGADDFLIKQAEEKGKAEAKKKEAAVKTPPKKPEPVKEATSTKPETPPVKVEKKAEEKAEKKQAKTAEKPAQPQKIEPSASNTNRRGSSQNFNARPVQD